MLLDAPCPCGHATPYATCCRPLHRAERAASTAEELMRSRYAAFALGEADYLLRTWHPDQRAGVDRRSLEADARALSWVGLTILDTVAGGPGDDAGVVAFEARYRTPTAEGVLRERSRFSRLDGAWVYVDGETDEQERPLARAPGRNDPCACGSGKKFKRCCGP